MSHLQTPIGMGDLHSPENRGEGDVASGEAPKELLSCVGDPHKLERLARGVALWDLLLTG